MEDSNPELESFRQQWKAEVSAKQQTSGNKGSKAAPSKQHRKPSFTRLPSTNVPKKPGQDETQAEASSRAGHSRPRRSSGQDVDRGEAGGSREPQSALEHYEKAVERETQGSLGDSLDLYRKAFRMDDRVDQKYKNKHFPPSSFPSKSSQPNSSNTPVTASSATHKSLPENKLSIKELVASFSGLTVEPAQPTIDGDPAPPCPLAELPEEILIHILTDVAILDVGSFARLAQVCKRMAYLVLTEEQIWKRVCLGSEVGFGGMHYRWQREVLGGSLQDEIPSSEDGDESDEADETPQSSMQRNENQTEMLMQEAYYPSWHQMFRTRPRIRFNGCYISTVNYMRAGQASPSSTSWHSPVHIVTYFRYLRFFRDGTVISLLTTAEPVDVIHHLTKELMETHRGGAAAYLPSIVMQQALRGRWRLSSIDDNPEANLKDSEEDLFVETEGANEKYLYRMKFSLRSAGKGARNTKLAWQGFWSYNALTDDTGEFTLRNDKAFVWSRVLSYGSGS